MKRSLLHILVILLTGVAGVYSQRKDSSKTRQPKKNEAQNIAIVVDERLSVLLMEPSLYAVPIQRMRRGRQLQILRSKEADGVTFFEVKTSQNRKRKGWVQSEAVIGNFRRNDDQRLARLVQASDGFAQIERSVFFLSYFPKSKLRPSILLLFGDLIEEKSLTLSKKAAAKFDRREMAASGAPLHSFYLNYSGLDRYRKLGIRFLFNVSTKSFHYDGGAWFELINKFAKTQEAEEAKTRLDFLKEKMERKGN